MTDQTVFRCVEVFLGGLRLAGLTWIFGIACGALLGYAIAKWREAKAKERECRAGARR
jgi:hypothetical protein